MAQKFDENAYDDIIQEMAKKYGVSAGLIKSVMKTESSFNPNAASGTGPVGLMQISKALAKDYGYSNEDRLDPRKNIEMGARYLAANLKAFNGDTRKALYGYNQGTGAAQQYFAGKRPAAKEGLNYINNPNFQTFSPTNLNRSNATQAQAENAPTAAAYVAPRAAGIEKPAMPGQEAVTAATQGDNPANYQGPNQMANPPQDVKKELTPDQWKEQDAAALKQFKKDQNMNRLSKIKDIADTLQTVVSPKTPELGYGPMGGSAAPAARSQFSYNPQQSMIQQIMGQQMQSLYTPQQNKFF